MNTGYYKLNTSTLQILTRAFEANPNGDLEETLKRIYTTYPQLRSQTDKRRARLQEKENRPNSAPDKPVFVPACRTTRQTVLLPRLPLSIDTPSCINLPLDPRVLFSLSVDLQRYTASEVAESLLRTLHAREPMSCSGRRIIVPLNESVVVKLGHDIDTEELALLQLLHCRVPTIVAPRALGYMTIGSISCMFMTRLPGDTLQDRWTTMNVQEKMHVRLLLDNMLSDLRKVELPNKSPMGSVSGRRSCKDCRRYIRASAEPIYDESHFNEFLTRSDKSRASTGYRRWITSMLRHDHRILLTHGDLHPGNIIVDTDEHGHMSVGLVDWEMSGFYPEYWEMLKAMNTRAITDSSDWWEFLPQCIMGYDQEIAVDRMVENTLLK